MEGILNFRQTTTSERCPESSAVRFLVRESAEIIDTDADAIPRLAVMVGGEQFVADHDGVDSR
jgi:hypothetical protein